MVTLDLTGTQTVSLLAILLSNLVVQINRLNIKTESLVKTY